jgi:hypothetical protein
MGFTTEEQETVITTDEVDKFWHLYTRQSRIMTKMKRAGIKPYKVTEEDGRIIEAFYKFDYNQLSITKKKVKKELTEKQKKEIAERFAKARESR